MKVYLDLDGTIIQTVSGKTFPVDISDWEFIPGVLEALVKFYYEHQPEEIVIITNQAGINLGYQKPLDFFHKLVEIVENIQQYFRWNSIDININSIVAPAHSSPNRKPYVMPGKIKGFMIGDASGISYLQKGEITPEIVKVGREKWSKGHIKFRFGIKNYTMSHSSSESANFTVRSKDLHREGDYNICIMEVREDFSDSDKEHARLNKLEYIDIEEFLERYNKK